MTEQLKPCPFCNSANVKQGGDDKVVGVWCENCGASGPNGYLTSNGDFEWNTRPTPQPSREAIVDLIRFCLKFTDEQAGEGNVVAHDGLCDRWDNLGWDVGDKGWIDDAILEAFPAPVDRWRPMDDPELERIKRNGTEVLAYVGPRYVGGSLILSFYKENGIAAWRDWDHDIWEPTHWRPLPPAPGTDPTPDPQHVDAVKEAAGVLCAHIPNPVFDNLKGRMMGEFSWNIERFDEGGNEITEHIVVPWTTCKEIVGAALRALEGGDS